MSQELIFAKALEEVRSLAKEQGNFVSKEQIMEAFAELNLQEAQLEPIYEYLKTIAHILTI